MIVFTNVRLRGINSVVALLTVAFVAVLLAWFGTAIIVYFATDLGKLLGEKVLIAVERLMGMVLVAVAIQMLLTGLDLYFAR